MSLKKAQVLMRGLKEKLEFRLPSTYLFSDSQDSSGNPVLTIAQDSSWATGEQYAVIRIKPEANLNVNSIGQTQEGFGPHVVQIVSEESAVSGVSVLTEANVARLFVEMKALGTIFEHYLCANGDVPAVAEFTAAQLVERIDDLINPLTSAV